MGASLARRGRKRALAERERAIPTPERMAKAGEDYEIGDDKAGKTITTLRDSPLERAFFRKAISREQYDAGAKYRHHWFRAGLSGSVGSFDLNRIFASDYNFSHLARSEGQAFHRMQYQDACQHLGMVASGFLESVICYETPFERAGVMLGWVSKAQATAAATERLKVYLDKLRDFWRL